MDYRVKRGNDGEIILSIHHSLAAQKLLDTKHGFSI